MARRTAIANFRSFFFRTWYFPPTMVSARLFLGICVATGLSFGCSSGSSTPTHTPPPQVTASAAASASAMPAPPVSASAIAQPTTPPKAPLPPAPAGVDAERFEILASICGVAMYMQDGKPIVGCRNAPPFAKAGMQPDGKIEIKGDLYEVCLLSEFYKGSFSAAGKEQAILGIDPCGPDRANDISPGSVVLAERGPDGWKLVAYHRGVNIAKCDIAKRKNGSFLVCGDNMGAFGDGSLRWNFTLDFSKPEEQRIVIFSKLYKSAGISCMGGATLDEDRELTGVEEIKREFKDFNNDGFEDLRLTIERAHTANTPAVLKRVDAACKKNGNMHLEESVILGKYKRFTLEFRGNETTLEPTPETKKLLEEWSKGAPYFWWNVVGKPQGDE